MGSDIVSTPLERWSGRWPLRLRILAVNLFALVMLAGGILYLDSFRARLVDQRQTALRREVVLIADALAAAAPERRGAVLAGMGRTSGARLILFGPDGAIAADSWRLTGPTFALRDPGDDPGRRRVARALDVAIDWLTGAPAPPAFPAAWPARRADWPEAARAAAGGVADTLRRAPDRSFVLSAAAPLSLGETRGVLHATVDAADITFTVRDERWRSFVVFLGVLGLSLILSSFLARTIVRPLERLADAAGRVRLGGARHVVVPRLPERRDEIGQLARAVSDMAGALRERIDATEAFAADVAHELKNPLASLRSALETHARIDDPAVRAELAALMAADIMRLDRLITGIAEASRLEAEISRARFGRVGLAALAHDVTASAPLDRGITVAIDGDAVVMGDSTRLGQVVDNLVDNAVGFSPAGGVVHVRIAVAGGLARLVVEDDGPGIPPDNIADIFRRFYSARAAGGTARHDGLGLAIARAIVEAHGGTIVAENRAEGGARLTVALPAA